MPPKEQFTGIQAELASKGFEWQFWPDDSVADVNHGDGLLYRRSCPAVEGGRARNAPLYTCASVPPSEVKKKPYICEKCFKCAELVRANREVIIAFLRRVGLGRAEENVEPIDVTGLF
jgi:hypothetical protein